MLLYADDAVVIAEDEKLMRWGFDIWPEWGSEWSVGMRSRGVKRTGEKSYVGGEENGIVSWVCGE